MLLIWPLNGTPAPFVPAEQPGQACLFLDRQHLHWNSSTGWGEDPPTFTCSLIPSPTSTTQTVALTMRLTLTWQPTLIQPSPNCNTFTLPLQTPITASPSAHAGWWAGPCVPTLHQLLWNKQGESEPLWQAVPSLSRLLEGQRVTAWVCQAEPGGPPYHPSAEAAPDHTPPAGWEGRDWASSILTTSWT